MNSDQVVSLVEKLITAAGTLAVTLGVANAAQEGPIVESLITIVGALGMLLPTLNGLWKHNEANTVASAVKTVQNSPTVANIAPLAAALQDQGVSVTPTGISQSGVAMATSA